MAALATTEAAKKLKSSPAKGQSAPAAVSQRAKKKGGLTKGEFKKGKAERIDNKAAARLSSSSSRREMVPKAPRGVLR